MSGLSDSRAALANGLQNGMASPVRVYPEPTSTFAAPCIRLHPANPWLAPSVLAAGRRTQRWEVWAVAGKMADTHRYDELETMVSDATKALDLMAGWSSVQWERPNPTDMGGTSYLAVRGIIETNREV